MVELVLHEGRNRIVRRLLAAEGLPVQRLARTMVGPVSLGDLRRVDTGRCRAARWETSTALCGSDDSSI